MLTRQNSKVPAPPTPVTAETYAKYGYPFFKLYEETSSVFGSWGQLLSIAGIDKAKGNSAVHDSEANLSFPTVAINAPNCPFVKLNSVDKRSKFIPVRWLEDHLRN